MRGGNGAPPYIPNETQDIQRSIGLVWESFHRSSSEGGQSMGGLEKVFLGILTIPA